MPKYAVILMTPYCIWEDVEANTPEEAEAQCGFPPEFDLNQAYKWAVIEQDEDLNGEETK